MITIFNGRARTFGRGGKRVVYAQVAVELKHHLKTFKGAALAVLIYISLSADEHGVAYPEIPTICEGTGYGEDAVIRALRMLRDMRIKGERVLASRRKPRDDGKLGGNHYLIFPTEEEVQLFADFRYGADLDEPEEEPQERPYPEKAGVVERGPHPEKAGMVARSGDAPYPALPHPVQPDPVEPCLENQGVINKNHSSFQNHNLQEPAASPEPQPTRQAQPGTERGLSPAAADSRKNRESFFPDPEMIGRLTGAGMNRGDALRLATASPEECQRQLEYLPFAGAENPGAYLRRAIENGFAPPAAYTRRQAEIAEAAHRAGQQHESQERRKADDQRKAQENQQRALTLGRLRAEWDALPAAEHDALLHQAESRLPDFMRGKVGHRMYPATLNRHIDDVLLEGAGMKEPPPSPSHSAPKVAPKPMPPAAVETIDTAAADRELERIRVQREINESFSATGAPTPKPKEPAVP